MTDTAFEELLEDILGGDRSPENLEALNAALRDNPARQRLYISEARIHGLLGARARMVKAGRRSHRRRRMLRLAAGLLILLIGSLAYARYWPSGSRSAAAPVAVPSGTVVPAAVPVQATELAGSNAVAPAVAVPAHDTVSVAAVSAAVTTKEGEVQMSLNHQTARLAAVAATAVAAAVIAPPAARANSAGLSGACPEARIVIKPAVASIYWETAFTNTVPICWAACPKAVSARLVATGMSGGSLIADFAKEGNPQAEWTLPAGADEDLYQLELTYVNASGGVLKTVTSRVARVKGVNGSEGPADLTVGVASGTEISSWQKVRRPGATTDNAVIACDASLFGATGAVSSVTFTATPKTSASLAKSQTLSSASGYIGWKLGSSGLPTGWYTATAAFNDGTTLSTDVFRSPSGTIYSFH